MGQMVKIHSLFDRSACGDLEAQRELTVEAISKAFEQGDTIVTLLEGLIIAKMAASQGGAGDHWMVATMLYLLGCQYRDAGDHAHADSVEGELFATFDRLADMGESAASDMDMIAMADAMTPAGLAYAHSFKNDWNAWKDAQDAAA